MKQEQRELLSEFLSSQKYVEDVTAEVNAHTAKARELEQKLAAAKSRSDGVAQRFGNLLGQTSGAIYVRLNGDTWAISVGDKHNNRRTVSIWRINIQEV